MSERHSFTRGCAFPNLAATHLHARSCPPLSYRPPLSPLPVSSSPLCSNRPSRQTASRSWSHKAFSHHPARRHLVLSEGRHCSPPPPPTSESFTGGTKKNRKKKRLLPFSFLRLPLHVFTPCSADRPSLNQPRGRFLVLDQVDHSNCPSRVFLWVQESSSLSDPGHLQRVRRRCVPSTDIPQLDARRLSQNHHRVAAALSLAATLPLPGNHYGDSQLVGLVRLSWDKYLTPIIVRSPHTSSRWLPRTGTRLLTLIPPCWPPVLCCWRETVDWRYKS